MRRVGRIGQVRGIIGEEDSGLRTRLRKKFGFIGDRACGKATDIDNLQQESRKQS